MKEWFKNFVTAMLVMGLMLVVAIGLWLFDISPLVIPFSPLVIGTIIITIGIHIIKKGMKKA